VGNILDGGANGGKSPLEAGQGGTPVRGDGPVACFRKTQRSYRETGGGSEKLGEVEHFEGLVSKQELYGTHAQKTKFFNKKI